jgi:hypothetical protein
MLNWVSWSARIVLAYDPDFSSAIRSRAAWTDEARSAASRWGSGNVPATAYTSVIGMAHLLCM